MPVGLKRMLMDNRTGSKLWIVGLDGATLLHLMGLPVPASMDGRVLESLFGAEGAESRAVVYDETTLTREVSDSSKVYSVEEADEVRRRLDDLGYL